MVSLWGFPCALGTMGVKLRTPLSCQTKKAVNDSATIKNHIHKLGGSARGPLLTSHLLYTTKADSTQAIQINKHGLAHSPVCPLEPVSSNDPLYPYCPVSFLPRVYGREFHEQSKALVSTHCSWSTALVIFRFLAGRGFPTGAISSTFSYPVMSSYGKDQSSSAIPPVSAFLSFGGYLVRLKPLSQ